MTNTNTQTTGKAPTHFAYRVNKGGDKSFWIRIGTAWAHKDGKGYNIQLDSVPLDGKITLRSKFETE